MQYTIPLPADYDMGVIRRRVADRGHALDDRAGLGLKAYLIRERGTDGSPVNEYAPFYLWNDTAAMAGFLFGGGGFQHIVRDFGRPPVHHWTGIACHAGPARAAAPRHATRRVLPAPPDPASWTPSPHPAVHTTALAADPHTWQTVEFTLWSAPPPPDIEATERYAVLHLSSPELASLPEGRAFDEGFPIG